MKKILLLSILVSFFSLSSMAQLPSSFKESRIKKYETEVTSINKQLWIIENNISFLEEILKNENLTASEKDETTKDLQKFLLKKKNLNQKKNEAKNMANGYRAVLSRKSL